MPRGSITWSSTLTRIRSSVRMTTSPVAKTFLTPASSTLCALRPVMRQCDIAPNPSSAGQSGNSRLEFGCRYAAPRLDDVVDQSVLPRLLGGQVVVAIDIECHLGDRSTTVVGDDLGHTVGEGENRR